MREFWLGLIASITLSIGVLGFIPSAAGAESFTDVKLTEEQKKEMSALQKEVMEQKKEIINKYIEYGVFTEEKGQKIISHLEKHYNKLKQNGFVPKLDKKHSKHHHERDS
ncbi:YckD family protein [Metabacillus arenae]|uniref:YckD family protein n=1 Tax=Metabacillus arenae TaxID=2771434 RepID=A0A926NI02_9BACI|nr:YckD family protein [Metabacillus arenae]MBD1382029.1 YckD family protein [Metabacillus arenae]